MECGPWQGDLTLLHLTRALNLWGASLGARALLRMAPAWAAGLVDEGTVSLAALVS